MIMKRQSYISKCTRRQPDKKGEFVKLKISLGHDLSVTLPIPDFMSMTKMKLIPGLPRTL